MDVVVLGGSGRFGRALLPQLAAQRLHGVAVGRADGVDLRGNISLGRGLTDALGRNADVLVHAATDVRHPEAVDVAGTGRLVAVARDLGLRHLVYLSIVGADRTPFSYHRAKTAAEDLVRNSGIPYTIVRSTQWFPFVGELAGTLARFGVAPRGWTVAPCDVDEVATLVTRRVLGPPLNGAVELAGPEQVTLARAARDIGGHRVLHLGVPGRLARAIRDGSLLPGPGTPVGAMSWSDWVAARRAD